jgi:hypothetical protein
MSDILNICYLGNSGITQSCFESFIILLQSYKINKATIITKIENKIKHHAIVLNINSNYYVIKDGFVSGEKYCGEGSNKFSCVIYLLHNFNIDIYEILIDDNFMNRLITSNLTNDDLKVIKKANYCKYNEYIKLSDELNNKIIKIYSPYTIPLKIIDPRIFDLYYEFKNDIDNALTKGFKRLEEIIKQRINNTNDQDIINYTKINKYIEKFKWNDKNDNENENIRHLFNNTFSIYRNNRAHKEINDNEDNIFEFLLLNKLFLLEKEAIIK